MDISAIQAKLLLSQIGTKELTKANVAQNTKVIQKEQKYDKSKYTERDVNDKAEISDEAVNRFNKERDNVNDSMEIDKKEQVVVAINMGAITGFSGLSAIGPKFHIKMEASGGVTAKVNSEFKSVRN